MANVLVLLGAGSIGQAIARRVGAGKHVVLADLRDGIVEAAAKVLADAGFDVTGATVDVSSRASVEGLVGAAAALGPVSGVIMRLAYRRHRHRRERFSRWIPTAPHSCSRRLARSSRRAGRAS